MSLASVPEIGSVVRVRQRHFAVTDVLDSALPADFERPFASSQHLVSLSCVEDDGLGEELRVVWQLEPGAESREVRRLPSVAGFDPPADFDAFLDAAVGRSRRLAFARLTAPSTESERRARRLNRAPRLLTPENCSHTIRT